MSGTPPRKLLDILQAGTGYLQNHNVENPRLVCEMLAARLLRCPRLNLYLRFDEVLSEAYVQAMRRGVKRVAAGEPVQYVIGETGFMGHDIHVDRRALIPRPETEILAQAVLDCEPLWQKDRPVILELGTGSGCVIIALALAKPNGIFIGLDISREALELAKENAIKHKVAERIAFTSDTPSDRLEPESIDAIVANLPYIASEDIAALAPQIRDHEPRIALDGGADGLEVIRAAVADAAILLHSGGQLFLEIGERQREAVHGLLMDSGFDQIQTRKDLAGRDRIVSATLTA